MNPILTQSCGREKLAFGISAAKMIRRASLVGRSPEVDNRRVIWICPESPEGSQGGSERFRLG